MDRYIEKLEELGADERFLKRYEKILRMDFGEGYKEKHHVYPRSFQNGKKYIKDKENIVLVSGKAHYILHLLLVKMFEGRNSFCFEKSIYALNNMNRIIPEEKKSSNLYSKYREKLREYISKVNRGRQKTLKERKDISKRIKNTLVVMDKEGNLFRVSKNDPRYISGELVFYRTGSRHTDETKRKISESNKGYVIGHYKDTGEIKKFLPEEISEDVVLGLPEEVKRKQSKTHKDRVFWYNTKTGKQIRTKKRPKGDGWIRKRVKSGRFSGFDEINKKVKYYNIKTKSYVMIHKDVKEPDYCVKMSGPLNKIHVFYVDGVICIGVMNLLKYLEIFKNLKILPYSKFSSMEDFLNQEIKKEHYNMKKEIFEMHKKYKGKQLKEFVKYLGNGETLTLCPEITKIYKNGAILPLMMEEA